MRYFLLFLWLTSIANAADPDAWKKDLGPTSDAWKSMKQELVYNNGSEPRYLDQHLMTGVIEGRVAMALFEGLTSLDPRTLEPRAGVASSWESSPDGLEWTFHLRSGERWSDGTPITSETFRASWLRLLDPTTGAAYAELLDMVVGAEARRTNKGPASAVGMSTPDPLTLKVRLARPCPWFLSVCAFQCFYPVPTHVIAKHGDRWTLHENMVSNGPFILKEWLPREHILLVPNPLWRGRAQVRLNSITLLPYDDTDAAYRLFRQGGLHWMPTIPLPKLEEVRLLPEYYVAPYLGSYFYRFNCTKPPFDDKRVRKAFSLAIDRSVITGQVLKAGQVPATWFTPAVAGYEPPPGLPTDRAAARKLLTEAGYGPGGKVLPRIELLYNTDEAHKKVAEAISAQWEAALGVRVEMVNREWKVYLADMDSLNYQVMRGSWIGDYLDPDTFLNMWRTAGGNNRTGWSHAVYDATLTKAQEERDNGKRFAHYRELERILIEDEFPILPLYMYVNQGLCKSEVRGWWENIRDEHLWQYLWLEK